MVNNPLKLYGEFLVLSSTLVSALIVPPEKLMLLTIKGQIAMVLANIKKGDTSCKGCGSETSHPLHNEKGEKTYWYGAMKGTKDFGILTTALEIGFVAWTQPEFPQQKQDMYDFYCSKCFEYIMEHNSNNGI